MKKENGFTLVELLAAFVILGLLLLIVVPSVLTFLDRAEIEFTETQKRLVIQAGTMYIEDNKENIASLKADGGTYSITLQALGDAGYISLPLYDAQSKKPVDATTITIKVTRSTYDRFEYSITGIK